DNVLVKVTTDNGLVGWGEASASPTMTGETVESMMAAIRYLAPLFIGRDPSEFTENLTLMDFRLYGNASAKTVLEMSFYDLAGKAVQKSVAELLGSVRRSRIPVLWMLASGKLAEDLSDGREKLDEGFTSFKIKVGTNPVVEDIERAHRVRELVNGGVQLSSDANQGWSREDAITFVEGVGDTLDFIEQPIMGHDVEGMAEVQRHAKAPIGADEGLHSLKDIRLHKEMGAAQGGSLKMIKLGGVTRAYEAACLCDELGMNVNMAGKVAESSISSAAVLHISAAAPSLNWGLSITKQYVAQDLVRNPILIDRGEAVLPEGAGLGVEVDEDMVQKLAVSV
ncbi:MAG: L-alanine-DL-glutamate epimerase-like enolase superfamily enzyme, partial [Alphaproteobacteria bacterium]